MAAIATAEELLRKNEQAVRMVAVLLSATAALLGIYRALVPPCPPCRRCPRPR